MPTTILDGETYEEALHRRCAEEAAFQPTQKHTPNWFIDQYGHVYAMRPLVDGVSTSECLVDSRYSKATVQEKLLIAAAPELLEALEMLVDDAHPMLYQHRKAIARAAIAKATGGDK